MTAKSKCLISIPYICGIAMISLSLYLIITQPQNMIYNMLQKQFELVEGRAGYEEIWHNLDIYFRVWLFDVMNPDAIMQGATPQLRERGPYVYDMNIKKDVLSIDEETDEMDFLVTRTYHFNKDLSSGSEDDYVTIINSGYMGTMGTILATFSSFLKKLGNDIPKLFPGMEDLFIRAKVGNILFKGLPMECDGVKYKELKLICGFLMGKKPPAIKDTDVPGVYQWSFFDRLNGTAQGPLTVNRGVKNKSRLGDTTAFKGKRVQKFWKSEDCNRVSGTDSITWAPMETQLDYVLTYEPQICRWGKATFKRETVINGLIGWRYELGESSWRPEEVECYCPLVKRQPVCPTTGLMDLTPCQEAPIYYSEPHYLHGDPSLLEYAKGLNPDETIHSTFITIEPKTGVPLAGSKKLQLSAKIFNSPVVNFLANVSEGYFPILWVDEGKNASVDDLSAILQAYRLRRILAYLTHVPLVVGIFVIIKAIYLQSYGESSVKIAKIETLNSVLVRRNPRFERPQISVTRRKRVDRVNRPYSQSFEDIN